MQKTLPNVSTVFRDLSLISLPSLSSSPIKNNNTNNHSNNNFYQQKSSFNNNGQNIQSSHKQLYNYKQQKHEELMKRFKNSFEENRKIIDICNQNLYGQNSITSKAYQYPHPSQNQNQNQSSYQSNINRNYGSSYNQSGNQGFGFQSKRKKLNIPQIRYRHIEDFQPKNKQSSQQQIKFQQKRTLENQFYQDNNNQSQNLLKTLSKFPSNKERLKDMAIQYQQPKAIYEQNQKKSQFNYTEGNFGWANKSSKYEDKLQSYYQLCRKPVRNHIKIQEDKKQQKFIRRQSNQKRTMELDQAMKLLAE